MKKRKKRRKQKRVFFKAILEFTIVICLLFTFVKNYDTVSQFIAVVQNLNVDITTSQEFSEQKTEATLNETTTDYYERNFTYEDLLVNYKYHIPENYDLNLVEYSYNGKNFQVGKVITESLDALIKSAKNDGVILELNSSYRSFDDQKTVFDKTYDGYLDDGYSEETAYEKTLEYVAEPGHSEHETGLALDFGFDENYTTWNECYTWLSLNAYKFGFIYRYKAEKESITKIKKEPWHYRFVGKDVASEIQASGECLEEFLNRT